MSTPNNIQEKDYRPFYTKTLFKILILLIVIFSLSVPATAQKDYGACLIKDGQFYGIHENKYFPMNSVMKFPQALFVADWMQRNNIRLSDSVKVTKEELIEGTWSPKLGDIKTSQSFTYAELISYSLMLSDNNACDVLFKQCGAPKDVESYIRELGFKRIYIRKTERQMRADHSCCRYNKATPKDMALLLQWFSSHHSDTPILQFIWETMMKCETGMDRLPAATPEGAALLHKTGSGYTNKDGTTDIGDAGIYLLSDGSKLPICVFVKESSSDHIIREISHKLQAVALSPDRKKKKKVSILVFSFVCVKVKLHLWRRLIQEKHDSTRKQ